MRALFETLEAGQFGIFESPTGTGKSLSLICGALTWFLQREKRRIEELEEIIAKKDDEEADDDDWFSAAVKKKDDNDEKSKAKKELTALKEKQERMQVRMLQNLFVNLVASR